MEHKRATCHRQTEAQRPILKRLFTIWHNRASDTVLQSDMCRAVCLFKWWRGAIVAFRICCDWVKSVQGSQREWAHRFR